MELILLHPEVAFRDCETCKRFLFNEESGEIETFMGQPQERPKGTFPPCHYGPKECPKGSPEAGVELTQQNLQAYQHYQECKAVGEFPSDGMVKENAATIRAIESRFERLERQKDLLMLLKATGR